MQTNAKNANRLCPLPYMYEHDHDDEEVLTMWESLKIEIPGRLC